MWMVTFADLMALMLTLFVLLLTFSEMNVIRYQAVIGSLKEALGTERQSSLAGVIELEGSLMRKSAVDVDLTERTNESSKSAASGAPIDASTLSAEDIEQMEMEYRMMIAEDLAGELRDELEAAPDAAGVEIEQRMDEVVITFPSEITFASGSASLTRQFNKVIAGLAPAIARTEGMIFISGHTDNQPISGGRFRSNWDLSAARAASVAVRLLGSGVDQSRVTIQGYADVRPVTSNDTPEGRSRNRRIELAVKLDGHAGEDGAGPAAPSADDFRQN